ncbi:hypothetical protein [Shinella sp.]|jgi:hypothetical protein|uniref:hypothetical protein n=1 Tax=Shinella sp. TaxID=1870904 RepID=UPI003F6E9AAB
MAAFGLETSWNAIPALGLPAFSHELSDSDWRRSVKVYAVPEDVSETRYFVSATAPNEVDEVPPSLVSETVLLAHFTVLPDGETQLLFARPEVRAA